MAHSLVDCKVAFRTSACLPKTLIYVDYSMQPSSENRTIQLDPTPIYGHDAIMTKKFKDKMDDDWIFWALLCWVIFF